ncbi:unnamed protein product [Prorocentrum cordatum]|uniref:Uncharacterized protein n=1 Tax=Prorocentrum cordatum TaxID=2364126 RepID=A0ABN9TUK2_9DINO|nr:unnamed protein product [Polarella glacialis]
MSAYYGENANYQIPEEPPPSVMYAIQEERTTGAARLVVAEIQRLKDEGVTIPGKGDAASNKLEYLTTHMKVYQSIIAIFSTRQYLISSRAAHDERCAGRSIRQLLPADDTDFASHGERLPTRHWSSRELVC